MTEKIDFTDRRHFPGSVGNPFDIFLNRMADLEHLSGWIFAGLLLILALLAGRLDGLRGLMVWGFFLLDWALLAGLPGAGKSFGPAKPAVVVLALARAIFAVLPLPAWLWMGVQVAGTLLVIYGFWIEPHRLTITRQKLTTRKLPAGTRLTLLHLGDLHIERLTERERQLNRWIAELNPDLILFSGDFLNLSYRRDPVAVQAARELIQGWKARVGIYGVTGSPAVDLDDIVPSLVEGLPLCLLNDEKARVPVGDTHIDILGLSCSHKPFIDGPRLEQLSRRQPEDFTVLLYHSPDMAPEAAELGIDLQLSGHTHGGQVRLPFYGALFAASLYGKRFEAGRYLIDQLTLYVTRGIGLEGAGAPRVRFLCPPEIILWEIEGQGSSSPSGGLD